MRVRLLFAVVIVFWNPFVYGADDQQTPEYIDPNTGNITQFVDGYTGQIISREQFVAQSQQIEREFMSGADRILGEADQYLATASGVEDARITVGVINGIEQAKRHVSSQHAKVIKQAESLKPRQAYERPRVLVSGGHSSGV